MPKKIIKLSETLNLTIREEEGDCSLKATTGEGFNLTKREMTPLIVALIENYVPKPIEFGAGGRRWVVELADKNVKLSTTDGFGEMKAIMLEKPENTQIIAGKLLMMSNLSPWLKR